MITAFALNETHRASAYAALTAPALLDGADVETDDDIDIDEENNEVASEDISPDDDPEDAIIDRPFIARDEDEET